MKTILKLLMGIQSNYWGGYIRPGFGTTGCLSRLIGIVFNLDGKIYSRVVKYRKQIQQAYSSIGSLIIRYEFVLCSLVIKTLLLD